MKPELDDIVEEKIITNTKLRIIYMNVNSLVSKNRQYNVGKGIKDSNADVIFLAETKHHKYTPEYKVHGYYQAATLVRRAGAGGLLVMAKNTIKLHSIVAKNVLPEIQVIQFEFSGQTIIGVYRSPTKKFMTVSEKEHHKTLVDYLSKRIQKLNEKPFTLVGDFNLGYLAENDFDPDNRPTTEDLDSGNVSVNSYKNGVWSDFFFDNYLQQWVCEPTFPSHQSILDILMTPIGQHVELKVNQDLFKGSFDHYAIDFQLETKFETNETPKTRRVKTHANWMKFKELVEKEQLHTHLWLAEHSNQMAQYITNKIKTAYDEAVPEVIIKPPKDCYLQNETKKLSRRATKKR